jgi:hypothetical protein
VCPSAGGAGTTFIITFPTLQVGQPFYLYRLGKCEGGSCESRFVVALVAQQRDAAKHAVYRFTAAPGDPKGKYMVLEAPPGPFFSVSVTQNFELRDGAAVQCSPLSGGTGPIDNGPLAPAPLPGKLAPPDPLRTPSPTSTSKPASLRARIVSPSPGTKAITKELVFQVEAYDEKVGARDGAGIDRVEMFVIDSKNHVVHKRTETNAAYCALDGGDSKCTVYNFGGHKNRWPDGSPIGDTYTLRAVVYGEGGGTTTVETKVTINP